MQTLLFSSGAPAIDCNFARLRRIELGQGAWLDHQSGWLSGHEALFEQVRANTQWCAESRWMYDREVDVPRLVARFPKHGPVPAILERAEQALSARYQWPLNRLSACYYRDGRDSVAEHSDRMGELKGDCVIAIISLGAPRAFTLRPARGGKARTLQLGWGDLVVMGGTAQETFLHGVPKVAYADPRISIQYRPEGRPDVG